MWNSKRSINLSIVVCFIVGAALLVLGCVFPVASRWYFETVRGELPGTGAMTALIICFYFCLVFAGVSLHELIRMLFRIRKNDPFCTENVKALRRISWSVGVIAILTVIAAFWYLPLIFIAAASGFMTMILRVLKNVLEQAVALREENDLTV